MIFCAGHNHWPTHMILPITQAHTYENTHTQDTHCVSRMYVRAYLAIPCVSADDNVKHTKSNIRYDNKIDKMKYM